MNVTNPIFVFFTDITFPFTLKYNGYFHKDLENPTTPLYKETADNYTKLVRIVINLRMFNAVAKLVS